MTNGVKISSTYNPKADFVLYEGDCLTLLPTIPNNSVQLVVTSPPYNLGKPYESKQKIQHYLDGQKEVIRQCVRTLKSQGSICWQVGNYVDNGEIIPLDILLYPIFADLGLRLRNRIVWTFGHGLHASKRFSGRYEVILWFTKSDEYVFNLDAVRVPQKYPNKKHFKGPHKGELSGNPLGKNPEDVWDIPNVKSNHIEKTEHPAQFPVELVERLVLSLSNENDWVFDPYLGSGTTAIASLIHNRKAMGSELVPEYNQITKNRVDLAEQGLLQIRPRNRDVYDPENPGSAVPPQLVKIGSPIQPVLLESHADYITKEGDNENRP
ncbi:MAG: site-specific DNA-methyltransferase [Anaerolineaceae bacterium]|nr:site-specific DNA-methyltransferase [Anaerolineaceae bacterium]